MTVVTAASSAARRPQTFACTPMERLFAFMNDEFEGEGLGTVIGRCDQVLSADRIEPALHRLQERHAKLRVSLRGSGRNYCFELRDECPPISWDLHEVKITDDWRRHVLAWQPGPFRPEACPLVRFRFLTQAESRQTLILASGHHAIGDAYSLWNVYLDLLRAYHNPEQPMPPVEDGFNAWPQGPALKRAAVWTAVKRLVNRKIIDRLCGVRLLTRDGTPPGGLAHLSWDRGGNRTLAQACRKQSVSMFAALAAAILQTLARREQSPGGYLSCSIPASIRDQLNPPKGPNVMGAFVSGFRCRLRLPATQEPFWDLARRFQRRFDAVKRSDNPLATLKALEFVPLSKRGMQGHINALTLNNFGRLTDYDPSGRPRLIDFTGFGQARRSGSVLSLVTASVNGGLSVSLRSECLSQETIDSLMSRFEAALLTAIEASESRAELELCPI